MKMKRILTIGCLLLAGCFGKIADTNTSEVIFDKEINPPANATVPHYSNNNVMYHGGPVVLGTVNVYLIWYGNWNNNTATTILPTFITNLSNSGWINITTLYFNSSGQHPNGSLALAKSITDNYSLGSTLTDVSVQTVVSNAITNNLLPADANGMYYVLTSSDVNESSGFCTEYCGWHYLTTVNSKNIKYSFIGNPDKCPSACEAQTVSPNNNSGADGMTSIMAHELAEVITDPNLNAWYDRFGNECADKCAWNFGPVFKTSNGSYANTTLNGNNYLIQQDWVPTGSGYCAQHR